MKVCTKCKIEKSFDEFSKCSGQKSGLKPRCKKCSSEDSRNYTLSNKDKILKKSRERYYRDVDNSRKKALSFYYEHKETIIKKQSAYNKLKWASMTPEEKFAHGQKHIPRQMKWARENKETKAYHLANRRAKKLNATPPWLTKDQKKEIAGFYKSAKIRSDFHEEKFEVDHIEPLCGKTSCGLHVPWNLQILLAKENRMKNNKLVNT